MSIHLSGLITAQGLKAGLNFPTVGAFTVPSHNMGDAPFALTAPTSNSAGSWSYTSSNTGVATISGNTVTILSSGTSTIAATQAANGTYSSISTTAPLNVSSLTYATWNPADKSPLVVLTNGNLTCTNSGGETSVRATIGKSSGKWYWELTTNNFGTPSTYNSYACGISRAAQDLSLIVGFNMPNSYVVRAINENSVSVYSCSLDMDAGTFTVKKNGATWAGSTALGTAPTPGVVYYPTSSPYVSGDNFTMNFGATAFVYSVPSGYNPGLY